MLKIASLAFLILIVTVCAQNEYTLLQDPPTSPRQLFYSCFDSGDSNNNENSQKNIKLSTPQETADLKFNLPFFGSRYNHVTVDLNGYLKFTEPEFKIPSFPITLPNVTLPQEEDPSIIAVFLGKLQLSNVGSGVYYNIQRNLQDRTDQFSVELRERIKWDVRGGIIGSETFGPKHAIIVEWKNLTLDDGSSSSKTNTFQAVIATDEVFTYAIFNYDLQWDTKAPSEGSNFPYVGFNAGNISRNYEYKPYSQSSNIKYLSEEGWTNGFKGRHIFRVDESILLGSCTNRAIEGASSSLVFAPESGNVLGGTIVNITGPCFDQLDTVICQFGEEEVYGTIVDRNRAICIQPRLFAEGYIKLKVIVGSGKTKWEGKYFVENPSTATQKIFFDDSAVHEKHPREIGFKWNRHNLTIVEGAKAQISLWGYRESNKKPEFVYIDTIAKDLYNNGEYKFFSENFQNRTNLGLEDIYFGFLQIRLEESEASITPIIWSRPIPLAWYFAPQWERKYSPEWSTNICSEWIDSDRTLSNFTRELPQCPCTLQQALSNKGRYLPDLECDLDSNPQCFLNRGAIHCVRSGSPGFHGSEQQCCYDRNNYLMLSHDQMWGSSPSRSHNLGSVPWNVGGKVPTLSQWYHDIMPKYFCCMWQSSGSRGCETLRYERRPTEDCVTYEGSGVAGVFGDPHIITFDDVEYTFNGKGEFVLVKAHDENRSLDIQGRFEQMSNDPYKNNVKATQLTSIVARENISSIVEVRIRQPSAQWRYRLDVFVDRKRVYFDKPATKFQRFPGVTVYTPTYILNQSDVIMMFDSGAGVEVVENQGFITARVYLPQTFLNKTSGLFGNWNHNPSTNFVTPEGQVVAVFPNESNVEHLHNEFGVKWMLEDKLAPNIGKSLFVKEFGRNASYYNDKTFVPEFKTNPEDIIPVNRTDQIEKAFQYCGNNAQCLYDYSMTYNRDLAHFTLNYKNTLMELKEVNTKKVISCGVLETPRFGRKSNFLFIPGTKVLFECDEGFELMGDTRRFCTDEGTWNQPINGYTKCESNYTNFNAET